MKNNGKSAMNKLAHHYAPRPVNDVNFHVIVVVDGIRSMHEINFFKKHGFQQEAVLRKACKRVQDDHYVDTNV